MKQDKIEIENQIKQIESEMLEPDFWANKNKAQNKIKELQDLKDSLEGVGKYDRGDATLNIFSGTGGEDAEDWVRILLEMYVKFCHSKSWSLIFLDENKNDNGGYKSVTFEVVGKNVYGILKNESGVHRLVRKSPFNSSGKRQTSFAMVEVLPQFENDRNLKLSDEDLEIEFTRSSGPGGQNVNKRETAVRVVHKKTGISAFVSNERSQLQNKEKAIQIVKAKLFKLLEEQQKSEIADLSISKNTQATWGSQIRSYVFHPYQLVKDHRSNIETSNLELVLEGELDMFLDFEK